MSLGDHPHARGLPRWTRQARADHRIIPARAGFTGSELFPASLGGDHPRSRGVYPAFFTWAVTVPGSSPLARGLLDLHGDSDVLVRIIPARAGFTKRAAAHRRTTQDHPRSRGVYWSMLGASSACGGSSPLARGLLSGEGRVQDVAGIIPARAGFTSDRPDNPSFNWDHPRSREVYENPLPWPHSPNGSSPLARGLRRPSYRSSTGNPDHPRSRGVYHRPLPAKRVRVGSSPLARGLRVGAVRRQCGDGIIPARAGFTLQARLEGRHERDHPRSRGVYAHVNLGGLVKVGSSPLARGLRLRVVDGGEDGRIIPARAGFTRTRTDAEPTAWDHPRSRGVYAHVNLGGLVKVGSSPLARGLRLRVVDGGEDGRIIPARAGFTLVARHREVNRKDHPRSRGVYKHRSFLCPSRVGSSPLARGLLQPHYSAPTHWRIIPARAGFTHISTIWLSTAPDHPRSRGVYKDVRGR